MTAHAWLIERDDGRFLAYDEEGRQFWVDRAKDPRTFKAANEKPANRKREQLADKYPEGTFRVRRFTFNGKNFASLKPVGVLPDDRSPGAPVPSGRGGQKFDAKKMRYDLLLEEAEEELVAVLTFGCEKYEAHGWRKVDDRTARYYAALRRHLAKWRQGERLDPETGLLHLAHALCCLLFLLQGSLEEDPLPQRVEDRLARALEKLALRRKEGVP